MQSVTEAARLIHGGHRVTEGAQFPDVVEQALAGKPAGRTGQLMIALEDGDDFVDAYVQAELERVTHRDGRVHGGIELGNGVD